MIDQGVKWDSAEEIGRIWKLNDERNKAKMEKKSMSHWEPKDSDEWDKYSEMKSVVAATPVEQSRWSTTWECVVQDEETGKFYELYWESGSTESQDMGFEDSYHLITEVKPVTKEVVVYEKV